MSSWLAFQRAEPSVAAILPLSLAIFAYERSLIPIYASGPTSHLFNKFLLAALSFSCLQPWTISISQRAASCGLFLAAAPNAAYWIAILSARYHDAFWGPVVTHAAILFPMVALMAGFRERSENRVMDVASTIIVPFLILTQARRILSGSAFSNAVSDSEIFLSLSFLFIAVSILQLQLAPRINTKTASKKRKTPSKKSVSYLSYITPILQKSVALVIFFAVAPSLYPKLLSPVLPHPLEETYSHPSYPLNIHMSVQSVTGLVVVGEALPGNSSGMDQSMSSVRYLRAAHSLLGGVWMEPKIMTIDGVEPLQDSFGYPLGDSIYGAFVLQEAARLVNSSAQVPKNVLNIGLGIGVSATAFQRHGLSIDIVEIDPAVYQAARRFFGLPDPGKEHVFLEDARGWASQRRAELEAGKTTELYDIAVHDCFSGGGVPEHIFTVEFWQDLKSLMQPEGILVVNYAGHVYSDPTRMVAQTLIKTFGQCRAFHDLISKPTQEQIESDFMNIAFFCSSSTAPITFRRPTPGDFLGSPLRRHCLTNIDAREVDLKGIIASIPEGKEDEFVLTDAHNPLGKLQEEHGDDHWTLMREIMPDVFWETF